MADRGNFLERVGYNLRLFRGGSAILFSFFFAIRQASRNLKVIRNFRRDLNEKGYPEPEGGIATNSAFLHYAGLFKSLPRLAGRSDPELAQRLKRLRELLEEDAGEPDRTYLRADHPVRHDHTKNIKSLFFSEFDLKLSDSECWVLSSYVDSTVFMRDVLKCYQAHPLSALNPRKALIRTISEFETRLREKVGTGAQKQVPPPPEDSALQERTSLANQLQDTFLHIGRTMTDLYDSALTLRESAAYQNAPEWMHVELEKHFKKLGDLDLSIVKKIIAHELYLRSCILLCDAGSVVPDGEPADEQSAESFELALRRLGDSLLLVIEPSRVKATRLLGNLAK